MLKGPCSQALAVLGQIGEQTAVLLQMFDHGLPGPATMFRAVKEDDSGRPGRTGFAHEQIHVSDPTLLLPRVILRNGSNT